MMFRSVVVFGLLCGLVLSASIPSGVSARESNLTCPDQSATGWKALLQFSTSDENVGTESSPVEIDALLSAQLDEEGALHVRASGKAILRIDRSVRTFLAERDTAIIGCSFFGMTQFDIFFSDVRSGERAQLSVIPQEPITEAGRENARLIFASPEGVLEMDGAILVVSASDAPSPGT